LQKMAEAEELEAIERERALRRRLSNLKRGEEKPEVETLPPREYGKANLPTVSAGNISLTHEDKGRTLRKYFLRVQYEAVSINGSRKNTPTLPYLRAGLILIRGCARS